MHSLFARTRTLVDIDSVTGNEADVAGVVSGMLTDMGFAPKRQEVTPGRFNVLTLHGEPRVVLCTHLDTVGPFIPSSEDETVIHGRGACDAKGIAAAMIEAGGRLRERGVRDFGLLFVVGEETTSDGARATSSLGWNTEAVIVGEPTGNHLASGHKGMVAARLRAHGQAAHSGYPELGVSAISRLVRVLARLEGEDWGKDSVLGSGSMNVGTLEGGIAGNVISPSAEALVTWRVVDSTDTVRSKLSSIIEHHEGITVEILGASEPVQCSTIEGWQSRPVSFGTDLPWLGHLGRPYLVGPGSIHVAHTDDEHVPKAELVEAVALYERLVVDLGGGDAN